VTAVRHVLETVRAPSPSSPWRTALPRPAGQLAGRGGQCGLVGQLRPGRSELLGQLGLRLTI
jgi:hypothetical protein